MQAAAGRSPRAVALAAVAWSLASCEPRVAHEKTDAGGGAKPAAIPASPADDAVIAALRPFEEQLRGEIDLRHPPSAETGLGADPWKLARVAGGWVGILRGRSEVVLLAEDLRRVASIDAPRSPTGLAIAPNGDVWVTGELSPTAARFVVRGEKLVAEGAQRVPDVLGLRDVAVTANGTVWVLDERGGRLRSLAKNGASVATCHGGSQLASTPRHLVVGCATEHEVLAFDVDPSGAITNPSAPRRIRHDGPIWGFDAREAGDSLVVAVGGVEDKPLDRREGFFGWIDSFVYVYRFDRASETPVAKVAEVNVAESGVVTPKALFIESAGLGEASIFVAAYGSANGAHVTIGSGAPAVVVHPLVPGIRSVAKSGAAMVMADPLLDAWVEWEPSGAPRVVAAEDAAPPVHPQTRLGEALFFTTLMAPENHSGDAHSRFTCETCHFEGYVDGRTHHTGRDDIHAVTKPLVGLLGNRPYFTRALDPDLSTIAHAEFRVAGAGNGRSPFFTVESKSTPWLQHLAPAPAYERVDGYELRRSLMRFLASFSHRPSSAVIGRKAFSADERRGAALFRDRCETCHASRLAADDPKSVVPFAEWEASIFSEESPIVWARVGYEKTGVVPYVHPEGARTSSLRRLYKKYPYLTNGSAKSLDDVLVTVRIAGDRLWHGSAPADATPLEAADVKSLRAFLDLL